MKRTSSSLQTYHYSPFEKWAAIWLATICLCLLLVACGRDRSQSTEGASEDIISSPTMSTSNASEAVQILSEPTIEVTSTTLSTGEALPEQATSALSTETVATETTSQDSSRVESILSGMTLEEKVGQLFLVFFEGPNLSPELSEMITTYHIGGIVLFQISDNMRSLPQISTLINAAQTEAISSGAAIPLLVAADQEGGPVTRLPQGSTWFPSNMAIGATGESNLAREMAAATATELLAVGINMNLAPVVDVNDNPSNPVIGLRSFGSLPEKVAKFGTAMVQSYKENGIVATAKHFPGHGNTDVDSHYRLPVVNHDRAHLEQVELLPFRQVIADDVDAIMTAHVLFPAIVQNSELPATLSPEVLSGLLRQELGFNGLIVSDSLTMGALTERYSVEQIAEMAFRAGADILAYGADRGHSPTEQKLAYHHLLQVIQREPALQQQLDLSVRRILQVKQNFGLLDWTPVVIDEIPNKVGTAEHRQLASKISQKSITLVRNESAVFPLNPADSTLLIWNESASSLIEPLSRCQSNLGTLQVSLNPTEEEIQSVIQQAPAYSNLVVTTLNARAYWGQVNLVNALLGHDVVVAALHVPYDLVAFPQVQTYIATYGSVPSTMEALALALCGEIIPTGQLPVDIPGVANAHAN